MRFILIRSNSGVCHKHICCIEPLAISLGTTHKVNDVARHRLRCVSSARSTWPIEIDAVEMEIAAWKEQRSPQGDGKRQRIC